MEDRFYWIIIVVLCVGAGCVYWWMYRRVQQLTKKNNELSGQKENGLKSNFEFELAPYKLDPPLIKKCAECHPVSCIS